jgi:hypothetical protein
MKYKTVFYNVRIAQNVKGFTTKCINVSLVTMQQISLSYGTGLRIKLLRGNSIFFYLKGGGDVNKLQRGNLICIPSREKLSNF